jgi:pimeloyl-ACP methyl ester carboxylesterase
MLAPWPETLWAFRRIWQRVTALGRVVAIDLPGFGHSDQSRAELIAPDSSGAFLGRLIEEWGLGAPHVVGPDVGTAAALFLAAQAPERVTSLTIGGGAVRFPIDAGGALKDVIEAPSLDVVRGLDARTNIATRSRRALQARASPRSMRTMSVPTISGASQSRLDSSGTIPSKIRRFGTCSRRS